MQLSGKCPFHPSSSWSDISENIRSYVQELKRWVDIIVDSPEKEQAIFAYRIYELAEHISELESYLDTFAELMTEEKNILSYKELSDEMKKYLIKFWELFFPRFENDPIRVSRLLAWLDTFHSFVKRAVILMKKDDTKNTLFPYKEAIQFASTSLERANFLATNPDTVAWEGLFFDPTIDVSQLYLGLPISRPVYRCPVLYSWGFRKIIDAYTSILENLWEESKDHPRDISTFQE